MAKIKNIVKNTWFRRGVLVFLSLLTWGWFTQIDRYDVIGENLLENADFENEFDGWQVKGNGEAVVEQGGRLRLQVQSGQRAFLRQLVQVTQITDGVRFSAAVQTTNIVPGPKIWHRFFMSAVAITAQNKALSTPGSGHVILDGIHKRQVYQRTTRISDHRWFRFQVGLFNTSGTAWVHNLQLHAVKLKPWFVASHVVFVVIWILFGLWWLQSSFKHFKLGPRFIFFTVALVLLLIAVLLPSHLLNQTSRAMKPSVDAFVGPVAKSAPASAEAVAHPQEERALWMQAAILTKQTVKAAFTNLSQLVHFMLFFIVAIAALIGFTTVPIRKLLLELISLAAVTEILQLLTQFRGAEFSDFLFNVGGIASATLLVLLVRMFLGSPHPP